MSNSKKPKINSRQHSWEDIPCPTIPKSEYGRDDMLHLTAREFNSNAVNHDARNTFTWMMELPDLGTAAKSKWLVCASDAQPFKDIDEIAKKGCEPNQSKFVGDSLQGFGLEFQALGLSDAGSLVIASMCEDGQFSAVYAQENQEGRLTLDRRAASEWAFEVLDYKLEGIRWNAEGFAGKLYGSRAKIRWYDKWKVICMFRLPDDTDDSRWTIGDRLTCLPWTTGDDYIRSTNDISQTGVKAGYCEPIIELTKKYKDKLNTGNRGRKLVSKEAYIERYRGDDAVFDIPSEGSAQLPRQGGGMEDIIVKAKVKVHHFPVKVRPKKGLAKGKGGGWLENVRDIPRRGVKKGEGGEGGKKLTQKVFGLFSALYDDRPGFRRYKNQAVYLGGPDPAPFLREMGLPETYRSGDWFFAIEIDIHEVCDKDGVQLNALHVSKRLSRVSNQTFSEKDAFRQILLRVTKNVSHDDPERGRLSDYIKEKYPPKPSSFPEIPLSVTEGDSGTEGIGNGSRWHVFDADTGERMAPDRLVNPGELLRVAVLDVVDKTWCGHQIMGDPRSFAIEDITKDISRRKFGVTDEMVAAVEKLEGINPGVKVFGITVHRLGKRGGDGKWQPIERDAYIPNNLEFRPMRTIRLRIGNELRPESVKVCKVDVPTPERKKPGPWSGKRGSGPGGGDRSRDKIVIPECDRPKGFFCLWDSTVGLDGYLCLNKNHPWVQLYINSGADRTRTWRKEICEHLNAHATALMEPMKSYRLRGDDEQHPAPSDDGWDKGKGDMDILLNLYLRDMIEMDEYIRSRTSKIDKVLESEAEYVQYADDPTEASNETEKEAV